MERTFKIYPDKKLVVARFTGPIDYEDILNWLNEALQNESFSMEYDGIADLRKAVFKETRLEKVQFLASYIIEHRFTKGKWAILASTPMETALSFLFSKYATLQQPIDIFSTVEVVATFLAKDLEDIDLELED